MRFILLLVCVPMLALAACNRENVSVERNSEGGADVSVVLTEAEVNTVIAEALAAHDNPLLRNPQVNLQNDSIYVTGEHDRRDGNGTVSGNLRITVSVQDGAILAQVSEVSIEGVDVNDQRVAALNAQLQQGLLRRANRTASVTAQSVTITDSDMTLVFHAER